MEHLKGTTLGWALALLANIRLGWKGATRLSIVTFRIPTLSIMGSFETLSITVSSAFMLSVAFLLLC